MGETRRFGIRFTQPPTDNALPVYSRARVTPELPNRVPLYQRALTFTARVFTVIERAAAVERTYLRDQLDRTSASIPQLIAQGLALADMPARRALYVRARQALTDCAALLDMLAERRSVDPDALEPARALAVELLDELLALTTPPPRAW